MKLKLAFALTIAALLSGCVTGTRTIDLQPPQVATTKKMEGTVYLGAFEDKRVFEAAPKDPSTPSVNGNLASTSKQQLSTLIGRQRNGFGKAMGDVALPKGGTVGGEMRDLIRRGLEARGYTVVDDKSAPLHISGDVDKFWGWFSPGAWAVSFEARMACGLQIDSAAGKRQLKVEGYGLNKGQVASDENWILTFDRASANFLENFDKAMTESGL